MKKETFRKFLLAVCVVVTITVLSILLIRSFKSYIDDALERKHYDEKDVANVEAILKEYYENAPEDETAKREMILYYLINTDFENMYYYLDDNTTVEDYINSKIVEMDEYVESTRRDMYYDNTFVKAGDYHSLAVVILDRINRDGIERNISDEISEIDDTMDIVLSILFVAIYFVVILRFVFLSDFSKETYLKSTIKYGITLVIIYITDIVVNVAYEKIINNIGDYKNMGFFQLANAKSIINYGTLSLINIMVVFIVGVILYSLINIRDVVKYLKK